jgi:hypothetical protein
MHRGTSSHHIDNISDNTVAPGNRVKTLSRFKMSSVKDEQIKKGNASYPGDEPAV